jgi:predicted enzyme related to lactoylglutathione lyase
VAWFEIGTTDAKATESFYGELFGWEFEMEAGSDPDGPIHGRIRPPGAPGPVGTLDVLPPHAAPSPTPGHGHGHGHGHGDGGSSVIGIYTHDVAAGVEKAESLGATVVEPAAPTADGGVAAHVRDPLGNLLTLFSSDTHAVPGSAAGPGGVARFEIGSTDIQATRRFYEQAFGWGFEGPRDGSYLDIFCPDAREVSGGVWDQSGSGIDYATFSVLTDAVTRTARQARHLGAEQLAPATMNADGVICARLLDPAGALFGLVTLPDQDSPRAVPRGG